MVAKTKNRFKKLSDYQDYAESQSGLDALNRERRELSQRVAELTAEIGDDGTDDVKTKAAALVQGQAATDIAQSDTRMLLEVASKKLAVLEEACKMQKAATRSITQDCRAEMAKERTADHKGHAVKIDNILAALSEAIDSENKFVSDLISDGGDPAFLPCKILRPFSMGTKQDDGWTLILSWRQRLQRHGYLNS